jgi:thiamine-phosphate pyrophosphorylase
MMALALPMLYPILDASILPEELAARDAMLRSVVEQLIAAGVTLLQYRNKSGYDSQIIADCVVIRDASAPGLANKQRCILVLNDRPDLIAETRFAGVHIGQQDMPPREARAIMGPHGLLGVSTHNEDQLLIANDSEADYIAIGPVFATTSKQNPDPVVGLEGVRRARALTRKPLVAIGGITPANCRSVREAGADSVAVISSLFGNAHRIASPESIHKTARDFFMNLQ